jgi:hypothetical protein
VLSAVLQFFNSESSEVDEILESFRSEISSGVGVGDGDAVGEAEAVGVGVGVGVGFFTATPLFHTSFFPDFTQVNFLPFAVAVTPAFLQASPAFTAATALSGATNKTSEIKMISGRFICLS